MLANLNGLLWLLLLLGPFLLIQRRLHLEVQTIFLLLTRSREIALVIFSFIFLPGVLLHELSHYIMAKLLQVRTGRFSLIPQTLEDGRLQLGYVETSRADLIRDALIGVAPLLAGGIFVTYAGLSRLGLTQVWDEFIANSFAGLWEGIRIAHQRTDFWLWFYLVFTVSSTMLPSASDRRAWGPIAIILTLLVVASLIAGAGPWLLQHLMPTLNKGMQVLATVFGISLAIHFVLVIPLWVIRQVLSGLIQVRIV